jgi:ABC-type multidrug transport system ATPase subunit
MPQDLIEIQNLGFSYRQELADASPWRLVVDRFAIPHQSICRIIGGNMVGKTTLLRILAGLEDIPIMHETRLSGQLLISCNGKPEYRQLRLRNTFFLSHSDRMFPELTIWENVIVARNCGLKKTAREAHDRFNHYIDKLKILQDKADRIRLGALSSGGQALIRLARAYTWGAELIMIDEVTAHLDDNSAKAFFDHLKTLVQNGCSVVLVSHDRRDHELAECLSIPGTPIITASIVLKDNVSCLTEHFS